MKPFGLTFFDLFDFVSSNVLLPLGGLAIAIVGGWLVARADFLGELAKGHGRPAWHGPVVRALARWVAPALILLILLGGFGVLGG